MTSLAEYNRARGLTSIIVRKTTRQRLRDIGHKGQTYDDILKELIELWRQRDEKM